MIIIRPTCPHCGVRSVSLSRYVKRNGERTVNDYCYICGPDGYGVEAAKAKPVLNVQVTANTATARSHANRACTYCGTDKHIVSHQVGAGWLFACYDCLAAGKADVAQPAEPHEEAPPRKAKVPVVIKAGACGTCGTSKRVMYKYTPAGVKYFTCDRCFAKACKAILKARKAAPCAPESPSS